MPGRGRGAVLTARAAAPAGAADAPQGAQVPRGPGERQAFFRDRGIEVQLLMPEPALPVGVFSILFCFVF